MKSSSRDKRIKARSFSGGGGRRACSYRVPGSELVLCVHYVICVGREKEKEKWRVFLCFFFFFHPPVDGEK